MTNSEKVIIWMFHEKHIPTYMNIYIFSYHQILIVTTAFCLKWRGNITSVNAELVVNYE
jgi:hypothetical protein